MPSIQRHVVALAWALALLAPLAACAHTVERGPRVELVQTWPVEAEALRDPQLRDAHEVWKEMIDGASTRIDLAHFYASNAEGSRLEPIVQALEAAATRGVEVRMLAEENFQKTYPETLARLDAQPGIEVRIYDVGALMGGVLHAKFMLIDGREMFVGSQNFDFRALEHIQELGLRVAVPQLVRAYDDVFATDWALAGGADPTFRAAGPTGGYDFPVTLALENGGPLALTPVFSPRGWLPDESLWDLDRILAMIDGAAERVRVQLLSYKPVARDRSYWPVLETALRSAAARGVEVQLLVSHWNQSRSSVPPLKSLQCLPHIEVKILTVPEWSGGFIPFSRVIHAKYMVVDGERGWLGTSNWQKGYFHSSRNAGYVFEGVSLGEPLDRFFERGWNGPYAETVDPSRDYPKPRVAE